MFLTYTTTNVSLLRVETFYSGSHRWIKVKESKDASHRQEMRPYSEEYSNTLSA